MFLYPQVVVGEATSHGERYCPTTSKRHGETIESSIKSGVSMDVWICFVPIEACFKCVCTPAPVAPIMGNFFEGTKVVGILFEVWSTMTVRDIPYSARIKAIKEVLPVLFSPTSKVSGAKRAVWCSWKQRKSLSTTWSIATFPGYRGTASSMACNGLFEEIT